MLRMIVFLKLKRYHLRHVWNSSFLHTGLGNRQTEERWGRSDQIDSSIQVKLPKRKGMPKNKYAVRLLADLFCFTFSDLNERGGHGALRFAAWMLHYAMLSFYNHHRCKSDGNFAGRRTCRWVYANLFGSGRIVLGGDCFGCLDWYSDFPGKKVLNLRNDLKRNNLKNPLKWALVFFVRVHYVYWIVYSSCLQTCHIKMNYIHACCSPTVVFWFHHVLGPGWWVKAKRNWQNWGR